MARLMMDNGAVPMSYFLPAPYAVPAHQAPYYVIPQPAHAMQQYSAAPQYVYSPSSASEYGQSNGAPIFKVVPSQNHQHQYPLHDVVPVDMSKNEVTLQEALENALRQQKQPKAQMVQQIPQTFVAPHARHPVYVIPEGTMLGQPAHYNGYPVCRAEDVGDVNRSHLPFGALGNQQLGGVQYVNGHGIPITAPANTFATEQIPAAGVGESQPYGLPAAQPGMRWKLVPVAEPDGEKPRGTIPSASPNASSAPVMLLESPDADSTASNYSHASDSAPVGDNAFSAQSDDPYKQFLSLLFPKLEDKVQTKGNEDSEAKSKISPAISTANSVVPEMEMKAATPKSVRIIPVTDAPKEEKGVSLEGEASLKEKDCSRTDAKAGTSSMKQQSNKSSAPTLKPIRLVPSLDFVKKKESKHGAGLKQEKQVNPQRSQGKADSHQASAENCVREKEVVVEKNVEKVLAATTPDEAGPKMEVAAKRAREKSVEGLSNVENHTVQVEKGDEPFAKKKRLIADSETAAKLIQSVFRGYVVRRCQPLKHLRDIARVKSMLKEYQVLAADRSSLLEKCKDPTERTKISEGIMNLLLQLDIIQGVDPVVREIRKYTSKEVLKLQSEVDAAMALISVSPQVVSKGDESKAVDKKLATSEEPDSAETHSESVERPHDIATNGHETLVSKSEDTPTENQLVARPVEHPEDQVEDLLRKLLNKLPESGGCEGSDSVEAEALSDRDDSALISEVVKRLSLIKEQQRDKNSGRRRLIEHEFSTDSFAHGHVEMQEESTVSDMRASEKSSDEVLHSISTANAASSRSGMADDAASDSIFEPTTSRVELAKNWQGAIDSAAGGVGSHAAPDVDGEREENKLPISEPVARPTELELQNLAETVAADFVDVVLTHTEDTLGSVQPVADYKEKNLEGQERLNSHDTTLLEVSDDGISLLPQSASVDVSNGMVEPPKLMNVESELEGLSHVTATEISGLETQTEASFTNSAVIDGKETSGILKAFEGDNDGERPTDPSADRREDDEEGPQILCGSEYTSDNQSNDSLMDGPSFGSGEIFRPNVTGDDKERTSELGAYEGCGCKESSMPRIEAANEEATSSYSTKSTADEEEEQDIEMRDDAARQQFAPTERSVSLWNGLDSTCHDSLDVQSSLQSISKDSEEVATESAYLGVDEPSNYIDEQSRIVIASDESVIPEDADVVERMKVQIPNKSFPSQERSEVDSPTSVLDAVVSIAPAEDVLSEDIAEIILDDTASEQPSIQAAPMDDPEGMKMQKWTRDSSVYEEEALQLQSAISDLQSLNNEGEFFLNDESLQLESAISDLHSLNNSGQGFLNDLNPVEDRGNTADLMARCPSLKSIPEEVYLPKPPSLSPEALHVLEGGVCARDVYERLCPSSASSPSSEMDLTLAQHLIEENTILKELVKDVLKWSQWQSSATLSLHKLVEKLALEVLETKATAKRAVKCKQGRNKKAAKKKNKF